MKISEWLVRIGIRSKNTVNLSGRQNDSSTSELITSIIINNEEAERIRTFLLRSTDGVFL